VAQARETARETAPVLGFGFPVEQWLRSTPIV